MHVRDVFPLDSAGCSRAMESWAWAYGTNLLLTKARRANSPVECRDEMEEMLKIDVEKAVGVSRVDERLFRDSML